MAAPTTPTSTPARSGGGGGLRATIAGRPAWQWALGAGVLAGGAFYIIRKRSAASSTAASSNANGLGSTSGTPTGIDPQTGQTWASEGVDPFMQALPGSSIGDNASLDAVTQQLQASTAATAADTAADTALLGAVTADTKADTANTAATKANTTAEKSEPGQASAPGASTAPKAPPGLPTGVGKKVSPTDFPSQIIALTAQGKSMLTLGSIKGGKITGKNVGASGAPVYALTNTPYGPVWSQGFDPKKLKDGTRIGTLPQFKADIKG